MINMRLQKIIKIRSSFPTDEAVSKLLYLALNNTRMKWTMPLQDWKGALTCFAIQFMAVRISDEAATKTASMDGGF